MDRRQVRWRQVAHTLLLPKAADDGARLVAMAGEGQDVPAHREGQRMSARELLSALDLGERFAEASLLRVHFGEGLAEEAERAGDAASGGQELDRPRLNRKGSPLHLRLPFLGR